MANKQTIPNSIFPLTGDIESQTGQDTVTVTGMQKTPISSQSPTDGQIYIYDEALNLLIPGDPIVSGPDEPGNPSSTNPVQVAGIDEGNIVREFRLDSYGSLRALKTEELLAILILELRANTASNLVDKPAPDTDFRALNFTDSQVGA